MADRFFAAASALALLIACNNNDGPATSPPDDDGSGIGVDPGAGSGNDPGGPGVDPGNGSGGEVGPGNGSGGEVGPGNGSGDNPGDPGAPGNGGGDPVASCPLGLPSFAVPVGFAASDQVGDIAVDAAGNVFFATKAKGPNGANGVTKLSASGEILLTLPYGSVVATDAAGNAYVAGVFSAPFDPGLGELQPYARNDVFVLKLDATGKVVFARALNLCGCGDGDVVSIAVDASGRIAVSGSLIGTAVLSADGQLQFTRTEYGDVAFNSRGEVIVAGTAAHGFVFAFDAAGSLVWQQILDGVDVHTTSVAVDANDNVLVTGYYEQSIVLFGDEYKALGSPESGRISGAYLVKLDAAGALVWKDGEAAGVESNGVAVDASGNVVYAGAVTGNAGFGRITSLVKLDASGGRLSFAEQFTASGYGRGFNVATDACGSVYVSLVALDAPSPLADLRAYVVKLAQ